MPATNGCTALANHSTAEYRNFRDYCTVPCKRYGRATVAVSRKNRLNTATIEALYGCSTA